MKVLLSKTNQLGDNVVFLPVVQALAKYLPEGDLVVQTSRTAADLYRGVLPPDCIWAEPTDRVLGAWRQPRYFRQLLDRWRDFSPDAVYLPFDQGNVSHLLARAARIPVRVGVENTRVRARRFVTDLLPANPVKAVALSEWENAQRFARRIGLNATSLLAPTAPPAPDLSHLVQHLQPMPRRVLIHPGASHEVKRWPLSHYVDLANRLSESLDVWFVGEGIRDPRLNDGVQRVPPLALRDFVAVMARCAYFVGNNSGPMNLASALGLPSIVFSGPSPTQWDPFWGKERITNLRRPQLACQPCEGSTSQVTRCGNRATPHACMTTWSVEEIAMRVEREVRAQVESVH